MILAKIRVTGVSAVLAEWREVLAGINGSVYRSTINNNVWSPNSYPAGWEEVV